MPLTDEQKTALDALKGADPKDVADALQSAIPDAYQQVFRVGFGTAKGEYEAKLEKARAETKAVQDGQEALQAEVEALRARTPDLEKYQARLKELQKENDEVKKTAAERVRSLHKSRFNADLKAALIAEGIDPDYAGEVLVGKYAPRIDAAEDGTVKVLDDDGLTPIQAPPGELAKAFAQRVAKTVDPKWIASRVDRGAGVTNGAAAGGGNFYERIRREAQAAQASASGPSVFERLGMKPTT